MKDKSLENFTHQIASLDKTLIIVVSILWALFAFLVAAAVILDVKKTQVNQVNCQACLDKHTPKECTYICEDQR